LLCTQCGLPLAGGDEAVLFVCPSCGVVHEVGEQHLVPFPASTAAVTTELAVSGPVQYLAVWRLLPDSIADLDPVRDLIRRAAAPRPAYFYVPAFSLARAVVQRIGVRLTEVQPDLTLTPGAPVARTLRPALAEARPDALPFSLAPAASLGPGEPLPDAVSPILAGRREAWGLAHFIYMAIEAREIHDLRPVDLHLQPGQEDLIFLPAVWDPRCIHESNWHILLREFDGLVA
jgi:hypothetical protein